MDSQNITVRKATTDDIPFITEIDMIAGSVPLEESMWDGLLEGLGTTDREFLTAMFTANASNWGGVDDFIVVELNGKPVAGCAVFKPDPKSDDFRVVRLDKMKEVAALLKWDESQTQTFIEKYEKMWGPGDSPFLHPQVEAIIETVGVLPEARGQGLGKVLMNAAFEKAAKMGCKDIGIMVIHGNDPAQGLYEAVGFKACITYHEAFFDEEFPGVTKYKKSLEPSV